MKYNTLINIEELLPLRGFDLTGEITSSNMRFTVSDSNSFVTLNSSSYYTKQEIFNLAMVLIKLAGEMN